jgi:hypothetical protein
MTDQQHEPRDNRGQLFRNSEKPTPNHPDYSGSLRAGGVDYWISGWLDESQGGRRYLSLSVKPKSPSAGRGSRSPGSAGFE